MEESISVKGKELLANILHKIISGKIVILEMKILTEVQQACNLKGKVMCEGEETKTLTLEYKEIY